MPQPQKGHLAPVLLGRQVLASSNQVLVLGPKAGIGEGVCFCFPRQVFTLWSKLAQPPGYLDYKSLPRPGPMRSFERDIEHEGAGCGGTHL